MSRTFRNRHTVPKGAVVRDDGVTYFPCCPNKRAQRASWRRVRDPYTDYRCPCHANWSQRPRFRSGFYHTESKKNRKPHYREYKSRVKNLMRHERYDDILPYRRTGGWLSW